MKKLLLYINILFSFSMYSQVKKVKIKLVQYPSYCDNNTNKQDIKNTPNKSIVYSNKKLIYITDQFIVDTIITDKSGYIKTTWAYGTYKLFEPWKYYKTKPTIQQANNINMECLQYEWLKEDLKIVVSKKTTTVANNIILLKCPHEFPCLINKK